MSDDLTINVGDYFKYFISYAPYKFSCCRYCLNAIYIITKIETHFNYFTVICYICNQPYSFTLNDYVKNCCKKIAYINI